MNTHSKTIMILIMVSIGCVSLCIAKTTRGPITPNNLQARCKKILQTESFPLPPACAPAKIPAVEFDGTETSNATEQTFQETLLSQEPIDSKPVIEQISEEVPDQLDTPEMEKSSPKTSLQDSIETMKQERYGVISQASKLLATIEIYLQENSNLPDEETQKIESLGEKITIHISALKNSKTPQEWMDIKKSGELLIAQANELLKK